MNKQEDIAIIGMACIFPQAPNITTFWQNILDSVDAISEPIPEWEANRYLESGRINSSNGGYLKDLYRFDPIEFGIMPNSLDGGEPDHFLALRVAHDALQDAGYIGNGYDHTDTGIILGHSTYLHRGQVSHVQHHIVLDQSLELLRAVFPSLDQRNLSEIRKLLKSKLPQSNTNIAPGLVPNVMTGQIANRLNLKGPNYLIDAACSSSLLAVGAAIDELCNNRCRMMLAGGVNASLPADVCVIFTQLGALSKSGRIRPFEANNDGTLLGEGIGIVVLKRLSHAITDCDRIYAVIRGIGKASDGKGHGLLAPSAEGETLAIERAYSHSGVDPSTVSLIEAHGTGIPLGDKIEISALKNIFGERKGKQGSVAIGSVKSMISHCIPAAGIAGLIKSALALHHRILPPTLCDTVNPELGIDKTPFYVNNTSRPWISRPDIPRRASINAFGFGGINTHAILEQAPTQALRPKELTKWPFELCVFSACTLNKLTEKLNEIANLLGRNADYSAGSIAATLASLDVKNPYRLAIIAKDTEDLIKKIKQALKRLNDNPSVRWSTRNGIIFSKSPLKGKLAFMFPGEGSQYLGMFEDLALYFEKIRNWFDFWRGLYNEAPGETRTDIIFPPQSELTEQRRKELEMRLNDMDVGSEAVFIASQAMDALLKSLGVTPDVMVGHSTGESSALAASGVLDYYNFTQLADFIRKLNRVYQTVLAEGKIPRGKLLTVGALPQSTVEDEITQLNKDVVIAMDNCVNQLILFGDEESIEAVQKKLSNSGGICVPLPFERGYHTPQFSAVSAAFLNYYENIGLKVPSIPLYSCAIADRFPDDENGVRQLASAQWATKVRFRETVSKMYCDDVRYFIEVGPSSNLSSFVNDILGKKEYLSLPTDHRRKNGIEVLLSALAHLYVNGKPLRLKRLFSSRSVMAIDLKEGEQNKQLYLPLANTMPIIHINPEDRSVLNELLRSKNRASHETESTCKMPVFEPQEQFDQADSINAPNIDDAIMENYFDLMRGFLDQQSRVLQHFGILEENLQREVSLSDYNMPFLTSISQSDSQYIEAWCHLSVYEDQFLRDHILSGIVSNEDPGLLGLSCVPLMVSIEIMAEACALLAGGTVLKVIENVKALAWITLDDGELMLNVHAELIDAKTKTYRAQIFNKGTIAITADFSFEKEWCIDAIPELIEKREYPWQGNQLYTTGMFHGPIFQSIERITGWNDRGIEANLSQVSLEGFFDTNCTPNLILNPVLLDALGQLAAFWIAQHIGTNFNSFPSTIERIELYRQCPQNVAGLKLRAHQQQLASDGINREATRAWHFECTDKKGEPLLRATRLANIFFPIPSWFYEVRRDPLNGWIGKLNKTIGDKRVTLWQIQPFSEEFCTQSGGIFFQILAHILLSLDERDEWWELTTNIRKRREWLLGRACIKEAVRFWIFQQTGRLLYPADIVILHDEQGAPYVDGWWNNSFVHAPEVSLTHNTRLTLAAIAPPQQPVGVDIEQIGRIQHPEFIKNSLTHSELELLNGITDSALQEKLLRIWCAKEAVAKYFGLGLQGRPDKFEVSFMDDDWEFAHVNYSGTLVETLVTCEDDSVIAIAANRLI
ncbi:MAG: beta-ketoacyl synthase N-terminal-like domain-containing protein [Thermodesulfobacteriota bacterium]|nr:beta-ketoacyl synthase N-terminal-like domain-containing protein [Thermodesulfobacteriota bacterium]